MVVPDACPILVERRGIDGHSRELPTMPHLWLSTSLLAPRKPDKDEVGGSSPPRPTSQFPGDHEPCFRFRAR